MRTFDANLVSKAVNFLRKTELDFDPIDWISDHQNIALINDTDDMSLFEYNSTHVVTGHYFFKSRGKIALKVARTFLDEIFNPCYNIETIRGLVPLTHLGSKWITRQLGFKSYGIVKTPHNGSHEIFILTRKEHTPHE